MSDQTESDTPTNRAQLQPEVIDLQVLFDDSLRLSIAVYEMMQFVAEYARDNMPVPSMVVVPELSELSELHTVAVSNARVAMKMLVNSRLRMATASSYQLFAIGREAEWSEAAALFLDASELGLPRRWETAS